MRHAAVGDPGHHVYGPYESRPAGVYRVRFDIALVDADVAGDTVCAIIDVCCNDGTLILAERRLRAEELGADPRTFTLLAEFEDIRDRVEYRIYSTGAASLLVDEAPRLERVSCVLDQQPTGDIAAMDPAALGLDTRRILRRLTPHRLCDHDLIRLGNEGDGGYVCVDDWDGIDTALSFGIRDDISWDRDAADRGLRIYQFDHTVDDPAPDDARMVFERTMIAPTSGPGAQDLAGLIAAHDRGDDRPNIVLKMDIEGSEWGVLDVTPAEMLDRIAWIVCELHYFQGLADPSYRNQIARGVEKLATGHALVHVHSNVWGGYSSLANVAFPNVIEATLANRRCYPVTAEAPLYPTPLDRSCDPRLPDYFLGAFRY